MTNVHPNHATLETYNKAVEVYVKNTPNNYQPYHQKMLDWIDSALEKLPPRANVLEVGSGTPRDARYIRSHGFEVQCSDAAEGFVEYLQSQGENPLQFNLITDAMPSLRAHMVFANAVVPHFTRTDLDKVLAKVYAFLPAGGIFAFDAKQGQGEEWVIEKIGRRRYMCYWQPDPLTSLVEEHGFTIAFYEDNVLGQFPSHKWIHIVAQKPYE